MRMFTMGAEDLFVELMKRKGHWSDIEVLLEYMRIANKKEKDSVSMPNIIDFSDIKEFEMWFFGIIQLDWTWLQLDWAQVE